MDLEEAHPGGHWGDINEKMRDIKDEIIRRRPQSECELCSINSTLRTIERILLMLTVIVCLLILGAVA